MRKTFAILLAAASMASAATRAQGPACAKDLQNFVGLPVSSAALAAVGTAMAGHFSPRTRDGRTTTVTPDDLRQLGRIYKDAGIDDCEMRREFRAIASSGMPGGGGIPGTYPGAVGPGGIPYGSGPYPDRQGGGFAARAVCGAARGSAHGQASAQQALAAAVDRCAARGGDPGCCAAGAVLTR
jgi:hypothetical protein